VTRVLGAIEPLRRAWRNRVRRGQQVRAEGHPEPVPASARRLAGYIRQEKSKESTGEIPHGDSPTCNVLHATCNVLHATRDVLHAMSDVPPATCCLRRAACDVLPATCCLRRAACDVLPATCCLRRAACDVLWCHGTRLVARTMRTDSAFRTVSLERSDACRGPASFARARSLPRSLGLGITVATVWLG
jgi:hypothetical protein